VTEAGLVGGVGGLGAGVWKSVGGVDASNRKEKENETLSFVAKNSGSDNKVRKGVSSS